MNDAGTRLVGRTAEVARSFEVTIGNTPEVAVLIEGAPGIGKTVILQAGIDAAAAAGAIILQTRPSEAELRTPLLGPQLEHALALRSPRRGPGSMPGLSACRAESADGAASVRRRSG